MEVVFDIEVLSCFPPFPHRESNLQHLSVLELTDSSASVANKFGKDGVDMLWILRLAFQVVFATFALANLTRLCFHFEMGQAS